MVSITIGKWIINNLDGKGSVAQVVLFITETILLSSSLVTIEKLWSKIAHVGRMESIDSNEYGDNQLSSNGNSERILAILSITKTY